MVLGWFVFAFNAVAPILLLILLGYVLRQRGFLTPEFLKVGNKFAFHCCIPTLLCLNMYDLSGLSDIPWALTLFVVGALTLLSLLGLLMAHLTTRRRERIGVIAQCWMRSNSAIIGLPLAQAIGGASAMAVLSPLQAPAVIMYNSVSVILLSIYSKNEDRSIDWKRIARSIPRNPLIRGLLVGLACLIVRSFIPLGADGLPIFTIKQNLPFLYSAASSLSKVATPLALVVLGGQFNFSAVRGMGRELFITVLGRLVAAPIIGFTLTWAASRMGWFELTPALAAALIAIFASPVSVSSAPMSAEMNADEVMAGQLVVWTSMGSMFSLFTIIVLFQAIGWL